MCRLWDVLQLCPRLVRRTEQLGKRDRLDSSHSWSAPSRTLSHMHSCKALINLSVRLYCAPGILCFRCSWKISLGVDTHWAVWHAAGHAFESVGCYGLAYGEVDGRFRWSWSMWPQNRWAEAWCAARTTACIAIMPERVSFADSSLLPPPIVDEPVLLSSSLSSRTTLQLLLGPPRLEKGIKEQQQRTNI